MILFLGILWIVTSVVYGVEDCSKCWFWCPGVVELCDCEMGLPPCAEYCYCTKGGKACACDCYDWTRVHNWCDGKWDLCGSSGGCPMLTGFADGSWQEENSLLSESEQSNGSDVTDYYLLKNPLSLYNGHFNLLIFEPESIKVDRFDQIRLLAVDHPQSVDIGTTSDQDILSWSLTKSPDYCVDNDNNNQLSKILYEDGESWEGDSGDCLTLGFIGVGDIPRWGDGGAADVCATDITTGKYIGGIQLFVFGRGRGWTPIDDIYGRRLSSHSLVDVSPHLPVVIPETLLIKVSLEASGGFDQIRLTNLADSLMIQECSLAVARKQQAGDTTSSDILRSLLTVDSAYAEMPPYWVFRLFFEPPRDSCPEGSVRDFVLVSTGWYRTISEKGSKAVADMIHKRPFRFDFTVRPTNFRSYTEINYVLPERAKVFIGIYDISGRLVANLENRIADAGRYSILWDGSDDRGEKLGTGSYFVKLNANEFSQTKKVVLVR